MVRTAGSPGFFARWYPRVLHLEVVITTLLFLGQVVGLLPPRPEILVLAVVLLMMTLVLYAIPPLTAHHTEDVSPWDELEFLLDEERFDHPGRPFGPPSPPGPTTARKAIDPGLSLVRRYRKPLADRSRVFTDPRYPKNDVAAR